MAAPSDKVLVLTATRKQGRRQAGKRLPADNVAVFVPDGDQEPENAVIREKRRFHAFHRDIKGALLPTKGTHFEVRVPSDAVASVAKNSLFRHDIPLYGLFCCGRARSKVSKSE